ncbi:MAG TPA: hypothetical protein VGC41_12515 [Kofleriaceae bacterium]
MRVSIIATLVLAFAPACGKDDNNSTPKDAAVVQDAPVAIPDASCFTNPQTHEEIINACTDAQKIIKNPTLPLLDPDGSLPALPQ